MMMTTCFLNCYYFAFFLLSFLPRSGNGFTSPTQQLVLMATSSSSQSMHRSSDPVGASEEEYNSADHKARRKVLVDAAAVTATTLVTSAASSSPSLAADVTTSTQEDSNRSIKNGVVSTNKLASLLKSIPTFAIVDERGVPYFVVGEDAKLTSYFFLSYGEAKRILDVAISSSDKAIKETKKEIKQKRGVVTKDDEEEIGTNPWKKARITSVPLDLAVSLCSKGKLAGAYFRLAPSEFDIEDALEIDGSDDLPEGKVPLFYVEDFAIGANEPLYFTKEQLISDYKRERKSSDIPEVKVSELFATITEMLRPDGTDEELRSLVFVAPSDSEKKAKQCLKGEKEPFRLGERNIVL